MGPFTKTKPLTIFTEISILDIHWVLKHLWTHVSQLPWTVVAAINQLLNFKLNCSWPYGGYVDELPLLKPRFDTVEIPNLFCLTATELACTNDGGDHKVRCR